MVPVSSWWRTCAHTVWYTGVNKEDIFTTDPKSTWVHLLPWGTLGEAFPFFKPNYKIMEEYGRDMGADEVSMLLTCGTTGTALPSPQLLFGVLDM